MKKEMNWHSLEINEVFNELNTSITGLNIEESKARLNTYGFNELIAKGKTHPIKLLLAQFKSILILMLLGAIIISIITDHVIDALIILIIVLFSAVLGFSQEYRAENALEALKKMLSPFSTVIRNGQEGEIPAKEIVPGDIIVVKDGDIIPADARVIQSINLQVSEASLTGESMPVRKITEKLDGNISLLERKNILFSGTGATYGKGKGVVFATGMKTEFGKIAKQVTTIIKEKTPLERRTKELGKWFGIIALIIIITIIIIGSLGGIDFISILLFGIALAVAAVPEALPAIVIGSLAIGMYKMAKNNALVRKMSAVETLGSTTIICSDKTGTLTKGEMTVRKIYLENELIDISGIGYDPKGELEIKNGDILTEKSFNLFFQGLLLCNDAELKQKEHVWNIRGDPTEGALIVLASKAGFSHSDIKEKFPRVNEFPFSSERKRMTTIHSLNENEYIVFLKGATEVVLDKCNHFYKGDIINDLNESQKKNILLKTEEMAKGALRVLAIACKIIPHSDKFLEGEAIEKDMIFLGLVGMIDPPRKEVIEAVKTCKKVQIKPIMITGDHKLTAMAIGKEIRIYQEGDLAISGDDLEQLSDQEFEKIVEKVTIYARATPSHKLKIVQAWKKKGQVVAMTGDGVNDAPALKQANIGIAMGITGTEVTKEAADLILTDDNFATIIKAIEIGRETYDNIKKYVTYLLQANLVEIFVLSIAVLAGLPLPLLPIHILYINLATDGLPAMALGVSPPDPDIMERPPRPPNESIFTKDVKSFLLRALLLEVPILLVIFIVSLPLGLEIARTRLFLIFIFFELTIALNCRSLKYNVWEAKPHKFLILSILWEILLLIILLNIPIVRGIFGVTVIGYIEVFLIVFTCLVVFITIELTKLLWKFINLRNNQKYKK